MDCIQPEEWKLNRQFSKYFLAKMSKILTYLNRIFGKNNGSGKW